MGEQSAQDSRLKGITLAKQFPNSAEPIRGLFVLRQVLATSAEVDWSVIAPVPSAPPLLAGIANRPRVREREQVDGIPVTHPEYSVLPKRIGFARAGASMARASARPFGQAVERGARFVHSHALFPSGDAARLLSEQAGIPLVVSVHGSDLYTMLDRPAWREAIASVVSVAKIVICVGSKLAEDVRAELGAPQTKVRVIPDTYDDGIFHYVERPAAAAHQRVRLVSVGRLEPYKGQDVLLEAFARLLMDGSRPMELVLIGGGSTDTPLRGMASSLGIAEHVRFAGPLPPDRIAEELAVADLYLQPSRREGFGVALVEAMATGLPAVVTRSGGPEDIVTADSGVLVDAGDVAALAEGLEQGLARLGDFDREAIADRISVRFAPGAIAGQLVAVYREVLSGQDEGTSSPASGTRR